MATLGACPKHSFQRSIGGQEKSARPMFASGAQAARNKRQRLSSLLLRCLVSVLASIAYAAL
jgi:hypothetical protein